MTPIVLRGGWPHSGAPPEGHVNADLAAFAGVRGEPSRPACTPDHRYQGKKGCMEAYWRSKLGNRLQAS